MLHKLLDFIFYTIAIITLVVCAYFYIKLYKKQWLKPITKYILKFNKTFFKKKVIKKTFQSLAINPHRKGYRKYIINGKIIYANSRPHAQKKYNDVLKLITVEEVEVINTTVAKVRQKMNKPL